ncbi:hypothetical protein CGRA01v4_09313 [Colletotrichum graminicola]|nr:hypothetical protein CGRA01v4_09313 [Colletotrichum graminicola]
MPTPPHTCSNQGLIMDPSAYCLPSVPACLPFPILQSSHGPREGAIMDLNGGCSFPRGSAKAWPPSSSSVSSISSFTAHHSTIYAALLRAPTACFWLALARISEVDHHQLQLNLSSHPTL